MSKSNSLAFVVALSVGFLATACAKSGGSGPEARLGKSDTGRDGAGRYGSRTGMGAPGSAEQFKATGSDTIYFSSDSTDLTPEAKQALVAQARWLQQYQSQTVTIEGHADERGTREYNIALGARRAVTVRNFLSQQGVSAARIRTTSYGKERPVAVCNDISCWSQNRRAQTVLASVAVSRN